MKNIARICVFFISLSSFVYSHAAPTSLTYQGRILSSAGTPLEYQNVSFLFQVTDMAGTCIVYQEQVTGYDMRNSGGVFDVPIGKGAMQYPLSPTFTILDVFANSGTLTCGTCQMVSGNYNCVDSASTYSPAVDDTRKLRVSFYDGSAWRTISPDSVIRSVPFAAHSRYAEKLGAYSATDFLLKAGLPTCPTNTYLTYNGSVLTCAAASGASGGVTSVTAGTGLNVGAGPGGVITTTGTLNVNVGVGANQILQLNGSSQIPAVDGSLLTSLNPTNLVAVVPINKGGTGQSTQTAAFNALSPLINKGDLVTRDGANNIRLPAGADFKYLRANSATASGLEYGDVSATEIASLSSTGIVQRTGAGAYSTLGVTTPLVNSGTNIGLSIGTGLTTNSGNLVVDVGTGANQIPQLDGNGKLNASVIPGGASSQWTTASSNIYYNSGNVGVGTSTPNEKMQVNGNIRLGQSAVNFDDNSDYKISTGGQLTIAANDGTTSDGAYYGLNLSAGQAGTIGVINFLTAGTSRMSIAGSTVDIAGQVQIRGGTPGAGKVLTSDANGLASWQNVSLPIKGGIDSFYNQGVNYFIQGSAWATPFTVLNGETYNTGGVVNIGGSSGGSYLSPVQIKFYTQPGFTSTAGQGQLRMFINDIGNVGIGTSSVSQKLEVAGTIYSSTGGFKFPDGTTQTTSAQSVWTTNINDIYYNSGFVGIGTSTPTAPITLDKNNGAGPLNPANDSNTYITFGGWKTSGGHDYRMGVDSGTMWFGSSGSFRWNNSQNGNTLMTLNNGNLGIGTASPSVPLEVAGQVKITGGSPGAGKVLTSDSSGLASWQTPGSWTLPIKGGSDSFYNQGSDFLTMGSFNTTPWSLITGETYNWGGLLKIGGGASYLAPVHITFSTNPGFTATPGQGVERMRINEQGNVGIGTTSPSEKLEVNGNVKATSFISTSDQRLKTNVQKVEGLKIVRQLAGYSYDWKANGAADYGVIAQEVEAVMPHAVVTDKESGYKAVKYNNLLAPVIESIKELYERWLDDHENLERLKNENQILKSESQILKDKVESLESRLEHLENQSKDK